MSLRRHRTAGWRSTAACFLLPTALLSGSCSGADSPTAVSASPPPPGASSPRDGGGSAPTALIGKTIVGYQGWFGCPTENGGTSNTARWRHWFAGQTDQAPYLTVEMLPDISGFEPTALCITNLRRPDGSQVAVFSSASPPVVDLHFRWMAQHGIDGAAVQRFVATLRNRDDRDRLDRILQSIRAAAEAHGRAFYVTYDISGADPASVYDDIRADWLHLTQTLKLTASPAYLRDDGRPLLQLWGFGFRDRPGEPEQILSLMENLRQIPGQPPDADGSVEEGTQVRSPTVLLVGGVPAGWRRAQGDSKTGDGWAEVYRSYDVISPWAVGRYSDAGSDRAFVDNNVVPDLAETSRLGIGYLPVIFPGFSWANLMKTRGNEGAAIRNQTPRRCGNFLWQQGQSRMQAGAGSIFIAMFDEVDEATAIMPVVARREDLPLGTNLIALDEDGCGLPPDWYLRVSGRLADYLRSGQVPPADLSSVMRP